jgi:hypothetical protein
MERHELRLQNRAKAKVKLTNGEQYDIATERGGYAVFSFTFSLEDAESLERPEHKFKDEPDQDPQLNLFEPIK